MLKKVMRKTQECRRGARLGSLGCSRTRLERKMMENLRCRVPSVWERQDYESLGG